jgi:1-acyl-sn-glycerol-3-phosphate acyltransferase
MIVQRILYTVGRILIALYARAFLDLDILWHASMPEGPKLIIANHPSFSDPLALALLSPRPISILIAATAFLVPLVGLYLRRSRHIPVIEEHGRPAFEEAKARLQGGETVALFIEGHYSPPCGGFCPPRTGAVRLALSTGVPLIPVGIHVARERLRLIHGKIGGQVYPQYWYLRGPFRMTVGHPIYLDGDVEDRANVVSESNRVMEHVIALAGESERRT